MRRFNYEEKEMIPDSRDVRGSAAVIVACSALAGGAAAQAVDPTVFIRTYPNAAQGYASAMTINPDGSLSLVGAYPTTDTGPQALSLSPDGRFLAVAHGTAADRERLDVFAVSADASLTYLSTTIVPNSPLGIAWMSDDALAVVQTNFGGDNSVGVYRWDDVAHTLTEIDREDTGLFNVSVVIHPHGRFAYASDNAGNAVYVFEILEDDQLVPVEIELAGLYQFGPGFNPIGSRLYAGGGISGGGSAVLGFDVDLITGDLSPIPGSPFVSPGSSPNEVDVADGDRWAYVSHGTDATIRSFEVALDGSLIYGGYSFDVGLQGSLGEADTFGDLVFVTDNTTALDGKSGIYSFRINPDTGRLTMIGSDLYNTGSSTPDGITIWDPVHGIYLDVSEMRAGERAQFDVSNATPEAPAALAYSLIGPGETFIPRIGLSLGLESPAQAGNIRRADVNGDVSWSLPVPRQAPADLWFQVAQMGRVSNVVQRRVR